MKLKKIAYFFIRPKMRSIEGNRTGLIHFYFGPGCGKTSILLGHIIRALGWNMKVILIQFLKKHDPERSHWFFMGEYATLTEKLGVRVIQLGEYQFVRNEADKVKMKEEIEKNMNVISEVLTSEEYDMVLLDELSTAIHLGLVDKKRLISLITKRPSRMEVLISGREGVPELIALADYCTRLEEVKHPFRNGVLARAGIEF